ncbi:hypothetical protein QQS21_010005, partial [Conoideocrella luteorostrata]
ATDDHIKARLIWLHGFSDHCNNYHHFFTSLAKCGVAVHSFDQRGFGRSVHCPSDRGNTGPTDTVLSDITDLITSLPSLDVPCFLGGHSVGGSEVLLWAAQGPAAVRATIRGYIVEAPLLRLHPQWQPSSVVVYLIRIAACLMPRLRVHQPPRVEWTCRDEQIREHAVSDPLCHNTATLESIVSTFIRAEELERGVHDRSEETGFKSLWMGHGDEDHIASIDASRSYFDRSNIKDKTFVTYEGFYHIIHGEPELDKERFVNDIVAWILHRVP